MPKDMPNQPRDQVNGRSLAGAFARCELRLNTVVVLKGAPDSGGPFSMGQSYAQISTYPSRLSGSGETTAVASGDCWGPS